MPLQLSIHPNIMQYNCYNAPFSIDINHICIHRWHMSHICVRTQHMSHISWCLINNTMPLHLLAHFSNKLLQCPFISQHKRSLSQSVIMCPSISMAQYKSKVYYNHIHRNNITAIMIVPITFNVFTTRSAPKKD